MNVEIYEAILKLDQHSTLKLNDVKGACIYVHWGSVWITQQGDIKDHIVESGQSFPIAASSKAILTSLSDAGVSVMERCDKVHNEHLGDKARRNDTPAAARPEVEERPEPHASVGASLYRGTFPGFQEIDRHVQYAHRLRARAVADLVHRFWQAVRPRQSVAVATAAAHDAFPGFQEIERRVQCAHRLRARTLANALSRGWESLRGLFGAIRELA